MSSGEWRDHELALATLKERERESEKDTETDYPSSRDKHCAYPSHSSGSSFVSCTSKNDCAPGGQTCS